MVSIEETLGLSPREIGRRKELLRRSIPTTPGIEYLRVRAKEFEVQPWPFLTYAAHYTPKELQEILSCYEGYDGAENYCAVMEKLRDYYIIHSLLSDLTKKQKSLSAPNS
jgi:hypothetical protein